MKSPTLIMLSGAMALGLSACVISDDPIVNAAANAAAVGAVTTLLYNLSDGYYYDNNYHRLPKNYRPAPNVRVERVSNIEEHRRRYAPYYQYPPQYHEHYAGQYVPAPYDGRYLSPKQRKAEEKAARKAREKAEKRQRKLYKRDYDDD